MKRLPVLFLLLGGLGPVIAADPSPQIHFGIFADEVAGKPRELATQTLTIPLKLATTGFKWGFEIIPSDAADYTYRAVVYLPRPPAAVTGSLEKSQDSPTVVKTPTFKGKVRDYYMFSFDDGDPLGKWKIEIFLNDRLTRTFEFAVVKND